MTLARIQPSLRKLNNNLVFYNGKEIWPRDVREEKYSFFLHNNHFCLIETSEGISFKQALKN